MYTIKIKGVDKTNLLKRGTINVTKGADNRSSCSLSLLTTSAYVDLIGYDLQVLDGASVVFGGVIKTASIEKLGTGTGTSVKLRLNVTSNGYGDIPSRRTTTAAFTGKTCGEIATYMVNEVLNYAGANDYVGTGTINDGATLTEYAAVCKSIKTILDELADASGYKWYIDDARDLHFVAEDTVTAAAHDLVEGGAFTDYDISGLEPSLDNYRNKQFVKGGTGADGNPVQVVVEDATEIAARQTAEGAGYSSGVYGNVIDDSNVTTVEVATTVAENALKKYGIAPMTLNFTSFTNDWIAGTKLKVNLPTFGISSDEYYLIEEVTVQDADGVNLQSTISATRRKGDSFSTQRSEGFIEYFDKLTKKAASSTTQSGASVVVPIALTATNAAEVAVTTSEATAATLDMTLISRSRIVISFSAEVTVAGGAANLTAITYIDAAAQTYQPTLYCASEQTYVLSFIDYKDAVAAGDYTLAVKLLTDANTGSVAIGHARLVVQVYPQAVPYLANPTGFTATVDGSAAINLAWTNPTDATFAEVELYRYTSSLETHDRAWCAVNATLIYNSTGTSFGDTGLTAETTYYYKLFAVHTVDGTDYYSSGVGQSATTEAVTGATKNYVMTGSSSGSVQTKYCDEYNPDTWIAKTDILDPARSETGASTIGTKCYIHGGTNGSVNISDCDEYDPSGNSWASKTDVSAPARRRHAVYTIGSKGYLCGGVGVSPLQDCDEYDPSGNSFASKADMLSPARYGLAGSAIGIKGYIYGGSGISQDCDEYDPSGNSWASKTDMLAGYITLAGCTANGRGYIFAGYDSDWVASQNCDEYDASGNSWTGKTNAPPPARVSLTANEIELKCYIYGGSDETITLSDCDEYDPSGDAWSSKTGMTYSRQWLASAAV